jgi:hypothetical protein
MMKRLFLLTVLVAFGVQSTLAQTPGYEILYSFKGGADGTGPSGVTAGQERSPLRHDLHRWEKHVRERLSLWHSL